MANEKRLIDANALMDDVEMDGALYACLGAVDDVRFLVDSQPTVDAVEVVHGRWMWDVESHGDPMYGIDEDYGYRCSACGVWASEYGVDGDIYGEPPTPILHYCPNCGAKMDGGNEDGV